MSRKQTKHPGRRLLTLLLAVVVGYSALAFGTATHRTTMTPGLALDLEGGTQIILTPTTTDGSEITDENVNEAIGVIRQRVDASGVSEAQISRQGGQNIVVSLPGAPSPETLELVRTSAVLYFRPVIRVIQGSAAALAQVRNQIAQQAASASAGAPATAPAQTTAPAAEPTADRADSEAEDIPTDPRWDALKQLKDEE